MATIVNRAGSLLLGIGVLVAGRPYVTVSQTLFAVVLVLVCVSMVWCGDFWSELTMGWMFRGGRIDVGTPGWMVAMMGWLFLGGLLYLVSQG